MPLDTLEGQQRVQVLVSQLVESAVIVGEVPGVGTELQGLGLGQVLLDRESSAYCSSSLTSSRPSGCSGRPGLQHPDKGVAQGVLHARQVRLCLRRWQRYDPAI